MTHFSVFIGQLQDLPHLILVLMKDLRCVQTKTKTIHYFRQVLHILVLEAMLRVHSSLLDFELTYDLMSLSD
jgi:hypothetical protein